MSSLTQHFNTSTGPRIRILFIIWSLERGGAERFLAGLLLNINMERFEPVLCCLNWKGEWAESVEKRGIKVIALNKKNGIDFEAWRKLLRLMKDGQFNIVNTHLWAADVMGRVAAIIARVSVIIMTAQNVDIWKKGWHRLVDRILGRSTTRIIAVSEAVKDYYARQVGIPSEKIAVIPNAIDVTLYKQSGDTDCYYKDFGVAPGDFVLACVGRLSHQKGHTYLFESLSILKEENPRLRVVVIGDGEDRAKLEQQVKDLGVDAMVRFTGQRQDIPQILNFVQGLVLPSLFEGLPLCVLEAMAAGKPVIATDVGGTKEIFADGEAGFIVPPKDSASLAAAIKKLCASPIAAQEMGQAGRKIVTTKFSIEAVTRQTEELFAGAFMAAAQEN